MNNPTQHPLTLANLRAFLAVAQTLSFSAAGQALSLSQPAVSRQIKALEEELGVALFSRGTRHVEPTDEGRVLAQQVAPLLEQLDRCVRDIRRRQGRRQVSVSSFASFISLWLLPRLGEFERQYADIDLRLSASDALLDTDDPDQDLLLRFCGPAQVPPHAERLFGEQLTPVVSPMLLAQSRQGQAPRLEKVADLARHTLLEDDVYARMRSPISWRHWLASQGQAELEPRRWLYLNYTHQLIQAALAGQGVALARRPMVLDALARGDLVEPFGPAHRLNLDKSYWLVPVLGARLRPELRAAMQWCREQGALTRHALGEAEAEAAPAMPAAHQSDAPQRLGTRRRKA